MIIMNKTLFYFACFSLIYFSSHFQAAQAQAPAQCNTVYAVHDEGVSETQFFTYDLKEGLFNSLGDKLEAYDIEALDSHPQTRSLFAASGKKEAQLFQVDGDTGEPKLIGDIGFDNVVGLAFHFDGRLVAWADQGLLKLDIDTAEGTLIWPQTEAEKNAFEQFGPFSIYALAWNREGTLLYGVAADHPQTSTLWVYDSTGWNVACNGLPKKVESLETLPDGLLLYGFHNDKQLAIHTYNADTCETVADASFNTPYNDIEGIAWPIACTIPSNLEALRAYFESLEGVEAVEITPDGAITITQNGEIHQSQLDELVTKGTPPPDGKLIMEQIEDVNGDGIADFRIIYPSGDRQILYDVENQTPPPVIKIKHAETVIPGDTLPITIESDVALDRLTIVLTVNGTPIEVDAEGHAQFSSDTPGLYLIQVTVTDSKGNSTEASSRFVVTAPNDHTPPVVTLTSPPADAEITAPTEIIGTVSDTYLIGYTLAWSPRGKNSYTTFFNGSSAINNDVLGTLDPSLLMNGLYDIRVTATDANNQTTVVDRVIKVSGDLKVGHFSFTVEDLSIPMMGMPLNVLRTYDTRQKGQALDFGHGWSVNYQSIKVEESRIPGKDWILNQYGFGFMGKLCLEPLGSPQVAVTLPDGQVETFNVHVQPECGPIFQGGPINPVVAFQSQQGTFSKLESLDALSDDIYFDSRDLIDLSTGEPFNPSRYRLTTQAGYEYVLDESFGIKNVKDPNGNTLTYTRDGIIHSAGKSVLFTRDNQDRITKITDSSGHQIKYQYNAAGDLVASTDATDNTVRYSYNRTHAMTDIQDPLGRQQVRNIYDDSGRLIAQLDAEGNRTNFNHNLEGRQSLVTDRLGRVTQLYYDDRGNVTSLVDPLGNLTRSTYDHFGNQLSETDPLDNTTFFKYDNKFNLLEEKDPEGHVVKFTYNEQGQETTLTDAKGSTFEIDYDDRGNLKEIRLPLANAKIVNTIEKGLITETRDALGHITKFTYDKSGNKLTETDALGHTVTYTYDDNGNQLSESHKRTGADGNPTTEITSYKYDKRNRLIQTTDALGNVSKTKYNILGQEVARIDALERRTEYKYDVYGNLTETRYSDGTKETRSFDAEGNLLSRTDAAGQIIRYEYDKLDRQTKVIHPDNRFTQIKYDAVGNVIAQLDEEGNLTEFKYDKAGNWIETKNALGQVSSFVYDKNGNLVSETDANNHIISYQYDVLDRRIKTLYSDNLVKEEFYDLGGRLVSERDLAGRETQYEYDKVARLTQVAKFLNDSQVQTRFAYDEVGNRLSQIDANQQTTTWTYNKLGRVLSRTLPLGMTETFAYHKKTGHLLSHTDFNQKTTTFSYDPNNDRLLKIAYADGRVESFTYDVIGNRKTQTDPLGTTNYSYDNRHRLIKEVKPNQAILEYGYDKLGNRTLLKFTAPNGSVAEVKYKYDTLSRLQKVIAPDGETIYVYDSVGNREQVNYANGTSTQYGYDKLNRLTSLETRKPDNSLLASYQYTLAPTGHRTQITEHSGRVVDYSYDDLYRLKEEAITPANGSEVSFSYQYDAVGNRVYSIEDGVHTEYTYDDNDRLKKQGGVEYQYDNNGNTIRIAEEDNILLYSYDGDNRLIEVVTEENGQTTSTVTYAYDADGNRVQTNADGEVTQYVVESNDSLSQVIAELDQDNQIKVAYLYGDDLVSQYRDNEVNYYHYDGLGSTRTLTNPSSEITDSYTYEAFGELLEQTGETDNNYLYTGEQIDPNTGNYYLRARYYNPGSGRFLSMDSFNGNAQEPITLHKYLYGNADPVNMIDPSGYFSLGSFSVGNSVGGILSTMSRVGKVLNILDFVTDPAGAVVDKLTNRARGGLVLFRMLGQSKAADQLLTLFTSCNSFTAETQVTTEKGLVSIQDIQIGDFVLSYDEETDTYQYHEVTNLIRGKGQYDLLEIAFNTGESITSTLNHPFYLEDKTWRVAQELQEGDNVRLATGDLATVISISKFPTHVEVYNLTVEDSHTYMVGSQQLVVHNKGKGSKCKQKRDKVRKAKHRAYQAMDKLLHKTPNSRLNKVPKIYIVGAAYDPVKVQARAAFNGDGPSSVHPVLLKRLQFLGVCMGDKKAFGTTHTIGRCSEFRAANKLLWTGSNPLSILWTLSYEVRKGATGHAARGKVKDHCNVCQNIHGLKN